MAKGYRMAREAGPRVRISVPFKADWLVGIVDWSSRAGLPGVARESQCFKHLERSCTPAGRPRRKSRGRLRFERQYRD